MTEFTPIASTVGGVLIGVSSVLLLLLNGRIAGISGIVGGLLGRDVDDRGWRLMFLVGLLVGGLGMVAAMPQQFAPSPTPTPWLVIAGLAVGFGTRTGSGCTSGHGVCGMSRLSRRSFAATTIFIATGALTVFVTHHLGS